MVAAAAALRDAGIDEIAFYNYGHLRRAQPRLDRRRARRLRRLSVEFAGQGRRHHRRRRRHRPRALPLFRRGGRGDRRARPQRRGRRTSPTSLRGDGITIESAVVDIGDAAAVAARVRRARRSARPGRHPDQQRRRVAQSEPRAHDAGGLARRRQRQPERRLQLRLRGAAGHEGARAGRHRQHRLGQRACPRSATPPTAPARPA